MNSVEAEQMKSDQSRFTARIDRYRLSLSALPEGVVLFRQGHTVEWCNPAAEKHLGIKLTTHLGMALNLVFDNPKIVEYWNRAIIRNQLKSNPMSPVEFCCSLRL